MSPLELEKGNEDDGFAAGNPQAEHLARFVLWLKGSATPMAEYDLNGLRDMARVYLRKPPAAPLRDTDEAFARDQFAAAALTGMVSRTQWNEANLATNAWLIADEMMKKRMAQGGSRG
jgi:hypothetical protein